MCRILLLAGILGGAIPAQSVAQTAVPATEPDAKFQESLVVTATIEAEERPNLSAAVTVIDAADIAARQATDLAELLATAAGFTAVQSGSPGTLTSLFTRGSNSAHTLLLWNGVALNDPITGGYDWAHLSTEGVERVEIVRGPFSALWGSDAIGGVVQVLSDAPPGVSARLEAGGNDYRRASVQGAAVAGSLRVDLSGHTRRGAGELPNDSFDSDELAAHGRFTFAPGRELGLRLRVNDSDLGIPRDFFNAPSPLRHQTRRSRELAVPLRLEWGRFELDAQAARTSTELELRDPERVFDASSSESESDQGRLVLAGRPREGLWLGAGADWERQEASTGSGFGPGLQNRHQRTTGLFGQAGWAVGRWRFDAGLRRDDNDAFGGETTRKLGAVWRARDGVRLRASYGEGFHAPTLADLYFPGFSNPDLLPERSASGEIGLELERGAWRGALALFSTDFEDLIQLDFTTFTPFNTGRARSRGVELELGFAAGDLRAHLNGTYLDAENRATGERLLRRPRESANLVVTWSPLWAPGRFAFHSVGRFVGERSDFGGELPSYTTLEVGAAWHPARVAWLETYGRLENALDRRYEEIFGFPAPRRQLVGGIGVRF